MEAGNLVNVSMDLPIWTEEVLATHNGKENAKICIAYKGLVYDVSLSDLFYEGKHYFHETGRDLTDEMSKAPHGEELLKDFPVIARYNPH